MVKFGRLSDLVDNMKELTLFSLLERVFSEREVKDLIIELNTDDQLFFKNIDSTGTQLYKIGGEYAQSTQRIKGLSGKSINLYDTGDFYRSFLVKVGKKDITIFADTLKDGHDLRERWGDDIIGLTDENINELLYTEVCERITVMITNILLNG